MNKQELYREYERSKQALQEKRLSSKEYQEAVKRLAGRLKL